MEKIYKVVYAIFLIIIFTASVYSIINDKKEIDIYGSQYDNYASQCDKLYRFSSDKTGYDMCLTVLYCADYCTPSLTNPDCPPICKNNLAGAK